MGQILVQVTRFASENQSNLGETRYTKGYIAKITVKEDGEWVKIFNVIM